MKHLHLRRRVLHETGSWSGFIVSATREMLFCGIMDTATAKAACYVDHHNGDVL